MILTTVGTGTTSGEGKDVEAMPVKVRWSPGDIAAWLTVVLALLGGMLALAGRVVTSENRIEALEKAQAQQAVIIATMPDRMARMETKLDILLGDRGKGK